MFNPGIIHMLLKPLIKKHNKEAMEAELKIMKEISQRYIIPQVPIPIAYQMKHPIQVKKCCMEHKIPVPEIARRKANFELRKGLSFFFMLLACTYFFIYIPWVYVEGEIVFKTIVGGISITILMAWFLAIIQILERRLDGKLMKNMAEPK